MQKRKHLFSWGVVVVLVGLLAQESNATTLTVDAQANIFGAGHATPPDPDGGGGGILPSVFSFVAGSGQVLTFSSVTGDVSCCSGGNTFNGPDGNGFASGDTDILSFGGISGILHSGKTMFLVGLFLDNTEPVDPAPARLDFSDTATTDAFTQLAPLLNQVFFIGDGLTGTGSGSIQKFLVPGNATRLFLGFADAFNFGNPTDPPGFYDDNDGSLSTTFAITDSSPGSVVPEPNTWLLLSSGLIGIALWHRLQRKA